MAVARLSIGDPEFLNGLRADLESALWRYGFALSPQETREAREYFAAKTNDSDDDIVRDLENQLREYPPDDASGWWRWRVH
jgi:hypothetical protein